MKLLQISNGNFHKFRIGYLQECWSKLYKIGPEIVGFYNSKHNLRPLRLEHNILAEKGRTIFDSVQVLTLFQHF